MSYHEEIFNRTVWVLLLPSWDIPAGTRHLVLMLIRTWISCQGVLTCSTINTEFPILWPKISLGGDTSRHGNFLHSSQIRSLNLGSSINYLRYNLCCHGCRMLALAGTQFPLVNILLSDLSKNLIFPKFNSFSPSFFFPLIVLLSDLRRCPRFLFYASYSCLESAIYLKTLNSKAWLLGMRVAIGVFWFLTVNSTNRA